MISLTETSRLSLADSQVHLTSGPFFVIRVPLLSLDEFVHWGSELEGRGAWEVQSGLEEALARDQQALRDRLAAIVKRPEVQEALYVASTDLVDRLDRWRSDPLSKEGTRQEIALAKYFTRMAARPTPFGLCSGVSWGLVGDSSYVTVPRMKQWRRHARLDMDFIARLCEGVLQSPLRRRLRYKPNTSLYRSAGQLRYYEYRLNEEGFRSYNLVSLEETPYLRTLLEMAVKGPTFEDLEHSLRESTGASFDESEAYVDELVASQVLVPLQPTLTGCDPLESLISWTNGVTGADTIQRKLLAAQGILASLNSGEIGASIDRYQAVVKVLEGLPATADVRRLFHVDMHGFQANASLGPDVLREVERGVNLLYSIGDSTLSSANLVPFRDAFVARYGEREVPLTEVLDADMGIDWKGWKEESLESSPLLKGLDFAEHSESAMRWFTRRDEYLMSQVFEALRTGRTALELTESVLTGLRRTSSRPMSVPASLMALLQIECSHSTSGPNSSARVFLHSVTSASGSAWLGRFCHGDGKLAQMVQSHLEAEEASRPDAVFAELVHLPQGRFGNFIARPSLRSFDIPYLGTSNLPTDRQIPLSDLYVSVVKDRILLRSKRLGREIIPRLANAHNPRSGYNLAPYLFLWLLQFQDGQSMAWSWGNLESLPYLPRVVSGGLVLSLARWKIAAEQAKLLDKPTSPLRYRAVQALRESHGLPRYVTFLENDWELLLDLDNVLCTETLSYLMRKASGGILQELFPEVGRQFSVGESGQFRHEILLPISRVGLDDISLPEPKTDSRPAVTIEERSIIPPGGEWLYLKLYAGHATCDRLLRSVVPPIIEKLKERAIVDRWFFIRYGDPEHHLRIRIHGSPERLTSEAVPFLYASLHESLNEGMVRSLQLDTYEPEIERYGGLQAAQISENMFHEDSEAALRLLGLLVGDSGAEVRWKLTLLGVEAFLNDFGLMADQRLVLLRRMSEGYNRSNSGSDSGRLLRRQLGDRFRARRSEIEQILSSDYPNVAQVIKTGRAIIRQRSQAFRPLVDQLATLDSLGALRRTIPDLVTSHIHMHVNRMQRNLSNRHEVVLYDFLARYHESQVARARTPRAHSARSLHDGANISQGG